MASKIGNQLWLAMYNRGYEAWTAWRTYDMPGFNLPAVSLLPVPTRLTYPISEQNLNQANYAAASTAIGGDEQTTKFSGIKTKKIVLEYNLLKAAPSSLFLLSIPNRNISTAENIHSRKYHHDT
jgi:hypothetical protein